VRGVVEASPAERAGLQRGDLLVSAAGRPLAAVDDLFDALDAAGDALALGIVRGTDEREVEVALG
jgi:S1-C subfamily serine protease